MLSREKLERINQLARLQKEGNLSPSEKEEQQTLRNEYLQVFRQHMMKQVEGVKIIDAEGNDLTSEKVKEIQKRKGLHDR